MSSILERDAGFYSGSSEIGDDSQLDRRNMHTPTDSSDDSIEIKLQPITFPKKRNKLNGHENDIPLKKRIKYDSIFTSQWSQNDENSSQNSQSSSSIQENSDTPSIASTKPMNNLAEILVRHPGVTTLHRIPEIQNCIQEQPLELTMKQSQRSIVDTKSTAFNDQVNKKMVTEVSKKKNGTKRSTKLVKNAMECGSGSGSGDDSKNLSTEKCTSGTTTTHSRPSHQRNYKSMTRERRIEANARERTRVHTISAAFDTLRNTIPSYSNTQKMSKLSVLRVACSYILALGRMAGEDYSKTKSEPTVAECLEEVTRTVQIEGKVRKRKDE